ncbi:CpsB/CapC family capsule biosynthesis tyrosine phosphatase [Anaeromicropila herbilytica]|uniref:protein-tyrosine-phosphatase n=1 Tax=Anaeromicropila herbilytica TaxID=2785025 RepID=A0A7R7ENW8_9FIRM|nr:CpsB/CapC family capsule biosynthesis tyrosine phosphatase [Anaeromicropila herbilytica]BCN32263.1 tyrosine protein phosphatase [Anaeromicropila herbilytica]
MSYHGHEGYLDINAHILPNIDYGSSCLVETKCMLKKAYMEGIRTIVATPYYYPEKEYDTKKIKETYDMVCKEARNMFPDLYLLLGSEIYYHENIVATLKSKKADTLGDTSYVLIDFEPIATYKKIYQGVKKLIDGGYLPVLAHVEQYDCLFNRMERCIELIQLGTYLQLDCESTIGGRFNKRVTYNLRLLKENRIHFLGTNCRNIREHPPRMRECMEQLKIKLDSSQIKKLTVSNVERFMKNEYIDN